MSYTAAQIIQNICPALHTAGSTFYIELATGQTSAAYFGDQYQYAIALRASHMYSLNTRSGGDAGAVGSKSEGQLSISYQSGSTMDTGDLSQTHYGKQLYSLIKRMNVSISLTESSTDLDP